MKADDQDSQLPSILDTLRGLPLFHSPYLNMQLMNIAIVDAYIEQVEAAVLREYFEKESTPLQSAMFLSALSQMWIFGLYELLRTWKQMVSELIAYGEELDVINRAPEGKKRKKEREKEQRLRHKKTFERAGAPEKYESSDFYDLETGKLTVSQLRTALDTIKPVFELIEVVRVTLAKHEIPKTKGERAFAPGYGRIDMITGSIYWLVVTKDGNNQIIARRDVADACRSLTFM